jgi:glycosyltransferase involved in cell wall biosynthesis
MEEDPQRMSILMVDALAGNDYSFILCEHLQNLGLEVTLVATTDRAINMPIYFCVKHWAPSKNPKTGKSVKILTYLVFWLKMIFYSFTRRTDLIHFQFFRFERLEAFLMVLLRLLGTPLVHTVHNVLPHESRKGDVLVKALIYRVSHRLITHSEFVKEILIKRFGVSAGKIETVHHGNFDMFLPENGVSREKARCRLAVGGSDIVLLFFGFIRPYKGLDDLLDAFEVVSRKNRSVRLIIAGQCQRTDLEEGYKTRIHKMDARDRIHFYPGFVPSEKVAEFFMASDLIVLPYRRIDYSGIVHLAYAFGKPIIATDVGSIKEMVEKDGTGYIAAADSPENLSETIFEALSSQNDWPGMGIRGINLGRTKYNWAESARRMRRVYESVIRQCRSRRSKRYL